MTETKTINSISPCRTATPVNAYAELQQFICEDQLASESFRQNPIIPPPLPRPTVPAEELEKLAVKAAANGLGPAVVNELLAGTLRLEINSKDNRKRELEGYEVTLQRGQARLVVAQFDVNGQNILKVPESPLAVQVITFMQRLLLGGGYFNDPYIKEGVFCRKTLEAYRRYLAQNNLQESFNLASAREIIKQTEVEASLAYNYYDSFQVVDNDLKQRYYKYELAKKALTEIAGLIERADYYAGLSTDKLEPQERDFVRDCRGIVARFRPLIRQIFNEILISQYTFSPLEFSGGLTAEALWQSLDPRVYSGTDIPAGADALAKLNTLLTEPQLYGRLLGVDGKIKLNAEARKLVKQTAEYRNKPFKSLLYGQKTKILRLNRLLLETVSPSVCPQSRFNMLALDIMSFDRSVNRYYDPAIANYDDYPDAGQRARLQAERFSAMIGNGLGMMQTLKSWKNLAQQYAPEFYPQLDESYNNMITRVTRDFAYFAPDQFSGGKKNDAVNALYRAVLADSAVYGVKLANAADVHLTELELLNQLLRVTDYYDKWQAARGDRLAGAEPAVQQEIKQLAERTADCRQKAFAELSAREKEMVIRLNRLLLEATYQAVCPKSVGLPQVTGDMEQQLRYLDEETASQIDRQRTFDSRDPGVLRTRFGRAQAISDLLGDSPARGFVISYLRSFLRRKKISDLENVVGGLDGLVRKVTESGLKTVADYYVSNNILSSLTGGRAGTPSVDSETGDQLADVNAYLYEYDEVRKDRIYDFALQLYTFLQGNKAYAGRNRAVKEVSFSDVIDLCRKIIDRLKADSLSASETNEVLGILANLSDNKKVAAQELQERTEGDLDGLYLSSLANGLKHDADLIAAKTNQKAADQISRFIGVVPQIFSPRDIRGLAREISTGRALQGVISYEDLRALANRGSDGNGWFTEEWVKRNLPGGAKPGDYLYVSAMGIYLVPPDQVGTLPRVMPAQLAGDLVERDSQKLVEYHPAAAVKLGVKEADPDAVISDAEDLTLAGQPSDRIGQVDMPGVVRTFGEGAYWLFRSGSFSLEPSSAATLGIVANNLEVSPRARGAVIGREERLNLETAMSLITRELNRTDNLVLPLTDRAMALLKNVAAQVRALGFEPAAAIMEKLAAGAPIASLTDDEKQALVGAFKSLETLVWTSNDHTVAELIKRVVYAGSRADVGFTRLEREALTGFFGGFDAAAFSRGLSAKQNDDLGKAVTSVRTGLREMEHKSGLSITKRRILKRLGEYLGPDLFVTGARIKLNSLSDELLARVAQRAGADFNEAEFRAVYFAALEILRSLADDLRALSTKYQKPAAGWQGAWNMYGHAWSEVGKAALKPAEPVSQKDYLSLGADNPTNILLSLLAYSDPNDDNDIIDQLHNETVALQKLEQNLEKSATSSDPLAKAVANCVALREGQKMLVGQITQKVNTIGDKSRLQAPLNSFLGVMEQLGQYNNSPRAYPGAADMLRQSIEAELAKIERQLAAESDRDNVRTLTDIRDALRLAKNALTELITVRDQVVPDYHVSKYQHEIRQQEIMDKLSSDRFDRDKYERLKKRLPGLFAAGLLDKSLDFLARCFTQEAETVVGPYGETHKSIVEVLDEFFAKHPDGEIALSNLLPVPGDDADVNIAKTALSLLIQKIPVDQSIDLLRVAPALAAFPWGGKLIGKLLLRGIGAGVRTLGEARVLLRYLPYLGAAPVLGGASGLLGESNPLKYNFGPQGRINGITGLVNNPVARVGYAIGSWLAGSSDRNPRQNLSPQLCMYLAETPDGRLLLTQMVEAAGSGRAIPLESITPGAIKVFVKYFREKMIPRLDNAQFRSKIGIFYQQGLLPINLLDYYEADGSGKAAGRAKFDRLLDDAVRAVSQHKQVKIYDPGHSSPELELVSRLIQTVMIIEGEVSRAGARPNIDLYALMSFDVTQGVTQSWIRYQGTDHQEPINKIKVVVYEDIPEKGEVAAHSYTSYPFISNQFTDLRIILSETLWKEMAYCADSWSNAADCAIELPKSTLKMAASFVLMPISIALGFSNTGAEGGKFVRSAGDRYESYQTGSTLLTDLAETIGTFVAFESVKKLFYAGSLGKLKDGNVAGAIGDAVAVYGFDWYSSKQQPQPAGPLTITERMKYKWGEFKKHILFGKNQGTGVTLFKTFYTGPFNLAFRGLRYGAEKIVGEGRITGALGTLIDATTPRFNFGQPTDPATALEWVRAGAYSPQEAAEQLSKMGVDTQKKLTDLFKNSGSGLSETVKSEIASALFPPAAEEPRIILPESRPAEPTPEINPDIYDRVRSGAITPEQAARQLREQGIGTISELSEALKDKIFADGTQRDSEIKGKIYKAFREGDQHLPGSAPAPETPAPETQPPAAQPPAEAPAEQPVAAPLSVEAALQGQGVKARINGAFDGVNEQLKAEFIKAVVDARVKTLIIDDQMGFGNGRERILRRLINQMKDQKTMAGNSKVVVRNNKQGRPAMFLSAPEGGYIGSQPAMIELATPAAQPPAAAPADPLKEKTWAETKKLLKNSRAGKAVDFTRETFDKYFRIFERYFPIDKQENVVRGMNVALTALLIYHVATAEDKSVAIGETVTFLAAFQGVGAFTSALAKADRAGRVFKHPLIRFAADLAIVAVGSWAADKAIDWLGINRNGAGWHALGQSAELTMSAIGYDGLTPTFFNTVNSPDDARAFLDRAATGGGLAGYYTSANNRYYYSGVDDWNKKVRTEIASRRNRLAAAQARKKLIARLGSRNDRTVVNTVRDGRPYSYTIVARPGELDRTIAKLEAEIKEWEKKTIDDAWDRRQAFALSGKICRLQVQAIGLLEEIAISSSLSAAEKKKLASYLDDLPLFASRGFLDVPDEIDALVQKDEAVKGLFDQLIGGYENAAADFAFYDRIGRSDVTQNWNNPEFWQAEALAKLTEK